jgi:hypothetical protein
MEAESKGSEPFAPPVSKTWPFASSVAAWSKRALLRFVAAVQVPVAGE